MMALYALAKSAADGSPEGQENGAAPTTAEQDAAALKARKIHTVKIHPSRLIRTFSMRIPSCPYPTCAGGTPCSLGMYQNIVSSTAKSGARGRCLLWGHRCDACGGAYHQVENHGKTESYMMFRYTAEGEFIEPDELEKVIHDKVDTIRVSYFGKPSCGFGRPPDAPKIGRTRRAWTPGSAPATAASSAKRSKQT